MRKLLLLVMILAFSISVYAQRNDNAIYWNTYEYTAKKGMEKDFEKAAAKKTAMFNKTEKTAIWTYKIITGPDSGTYLRVEANKKPADYDLDRSAEGDYWNENVAKFVNADRGQVRYRELENGSYDPNPEDPKPSNYVQRTTYNVKADKILHFRRAMYRLSKVAEKREWTAVRTLFRVQSGGNRNQFILAVGFDTHKRAENGTERETTTKEDYDELFGWGSWDEDWKNFDASLEYWGEQTDLLQLMPEISTGMMN
ncbi:MAG: hypothetical protein BM564_13470 [Bacteroidetes bacterium MedPE-SWsnd-G2]|nr:MAG: hypothetical protein BM564_13470 [Bacteroidetes bacterium MedPE-SWsnd-G2]